MAQQFRIIGCEATLDSFHRTRLIENCTATQKHAMYLYHALKRISMQYGHTCVARHRLEREASILRSNYEPSWKSRGGIHPSEVDWGEALDFLEDWHVIVRENDGTHVYLHRYWNAEKKIAEAFHVLRKRHELYPWTFEIDAEKYVLYQLISVTYLL